MVKCNIKKENPRFKIKQKDERCAFYAEVDGVCFPFMKQDPKSQNCTSLTLYNTTRFLREMIDGFDNNDLVSDFNKILNKETGRFGSSALVIDYLSKNNFGSCKLQKINSSDFQDVNVFVFSDHIFSVVKNINTGNYILLDSYNSKPIVLPLTVNNAEGLLKFKNASFGQKFTNKASYKIIESDLAKKLKFEIKNIID